MKERKRYSRDEMMDRRMEFADTLQMLALTALSAPGTETLPRLDLPTLNGGTQIIDTIYGGNLDALALMGTEFALLATLLGKPDLIKLSPVIVSKKGMKIRRTFPQ